MRRTVTTTLAIALLLASCSSGHDDVADSSDTVAGEPAELGRPDTATPEMLDDEASDSHVASEPPDADADADAEPRFPDDVTFADYGVGDFVATADLATSTFATDADTASFSLAKAWLDRDGILPPAEAIRVEEWVNAVDHRYPDPDPGQTWRIVTDSGEPWWTPSGDEPETTLLRVGLQAERRVERDPLTLTLVIDTSGSMEMGSRVDLVKEAVDGLLGVLDADDRVAVVEYGTQASMVSEPTSEIEQVRNAVAGLVPGGSTNAEAGLTMGFDTARDAYRAETNNVVVLLSDGVANVGTTDPEGIFERVMSEAEDGIVLHSVGVGMDNFNDVLLERLANDAGGAYAYVDRMEEAAELFTGTLPVTTPVAHDVKAQVDFDEARVSSWRLVGYENRLMHADDFRDDTVGGGYVGAGHAVTALYEIVPSGEPGDLGTVTVRWADPSSGEIDELTGPIQLGAEDDATSVTFGTAAAVAAVAEHLRGSSHIQVDLAEVADRLDATRDVQDAQLAELVRDAEAAAQPESQSRQTVQPPGIEVEDRAS